MGQRGWSVWGNLLPTQHDQVGGKQGNVWIDTVAWRVELGTWNVGSAGVISILRYELRLGIEVTVWGFLCLAGIHHQPCLACSSAKDNNSDGSLVLSITKGIVDKL